MRTVEPVSVEGRIRIPYRWPAGKLGTHFLAALRDEGKILGLRCAACDVVHVPPRPSCIECGRTPEEWVPVGPEGELRAWTTRGGETYGLVQLDRSSTYIVHRLISDGCALGHGQRVTAVFAEARTGAVTDILGFRPL